MARTSNKATTEPQAASKKKGPVPWGGIITGGVVVLAVGALIMFDSPPPGVQFPSMGNFHLATIDQPHSGYNSSPPSSGPHVGFLANWGVSEQPIPPELFVHNLEDAGVVIAYDCPDGCDEFRAPLVELVENRGGRLLLTEFNGIEHEGQRYRGAAVAWTRVFYFDEVDDHTLSEIEVFINLYEGIDHHVAG
jgi:hypothetical protein